MSTNVNKPIHRVLNQCLQMSTKVLKSLIYCIFSEEVENAVSTYRSKIRQKRKIGLFYFCLIYLTGIGIHLFTPAGPVDLFYTYANITQGGIIVLTLVLCYKKKICIERTISIILMVCTLEISLEMLYQAINHNVNAPLNIMTNMSLLACIASLSISTYIKNLSLCISILSISTYLICSYLIPSQEMISYSYIIIGSFTCITAIGWHLAQTFKVIHTENEQYEEQQKQMINYMQLTKQQWDELMEALRITYKRIDPKQRKEAIELVQDRLNIRMTYQLKELIKEEQDYSAILLQECPLLTDMELKIANFIIKGFNTSQISSALNTTVSTVTTLRSRIRSHFELDKGISLQSYLQQIVEKGKSAE